MATLYLMVMAGAVVFALTIAALILAVALLVIVGWRLTFGGDS